jgi:hypothetical protein
MLAMAENVCNVGMFAAAPVAFNFIYYIIAKVKIEREKIQ